MLKILVTGGFGFLGSHVVRTLLHEIDCQISILDGFNYAGNLNNLDKEIVRRVKRIYPVDICSWQDLFAIQETFDVVVHTAAESHVTRSQQSSNIFYQVNLEGTKQIATFARNRAGRLINFSTDEVYGDNLTGEAFDEDRFGEQKPTSPYAESKYLADLYLQQLMKMTKFPITIVRPTNCFGEYQHPEKMLPRSIIKIISGEKAQLWGDGSQIRDWLYAGNLANAIYLIINRQITGIYNIAPEIQPEISNKKLLETVCEILKVDFKQSVEFVKDPRAEAGHHDQRYRIDASKFKKIAQWVPFWNANGFHGRLEETIKFYQNNHWWWQPLTQEAESIY
ncbi:MAG: dTDP-glucose 4,6-dehydratase [Berkelbacteria bacterium GW2011_GWA2_35_9]|uniref:dTDP-glucose 4,6-dehydratase n=1 Tax=Berkelbacteria bacterium GW2011_GWA2_35_9 TaxID=1618333 RepID=A0A0G0D457_9BACT|nr:MAG: dTDP-glucose 4,6-dehydratase [Berkelbacteria bacterium GW2011_GWA2_35_9]